MHKLRSIAATGGLQIAFAGKAHPKDAPGQAAIRHVVEVSRALGTDVPIAYLEDYDMDLARVPCAGVDVWVNTPLKPWEASGTSGMKAALNGVPSLSVLDGWWIEGHVEGVTGWSVGDSWEVAMDAAGEVEALYQKLEQIAITFATRPQAFAGGDAPRHRPQRFVLQRRAHDSTIRVDVPFAPLTGGFPSAWA